MGARVGHREKETCGSSKGEKRSEAGSSGSETTARERNPTIQFFAHRKRLNAAGYHSVSLTAKLGQHTTAAVKKFQGDRHLPVTGKLDAITLAALGVGRDSSVQQPLRERI